MVRSNWITTVLMVLASSAMVLGQYSPPTSSKPLNLTGKIIGVAEPGQPEQKCRVLHSWRTSEGATAMQVRVLATGEMMTIVQTGPSANQADLPSATGKKRLAARFFHWGFQQTPPAGTPLPPLPTSNLQVPQPVSSAQTARYPTSGYSSVPNDPGYRGWASTPASRPGITTSVAATGGPAASAGATLPSRTVSGPSSSAVNSGNPSPYAAAAGTPTRPSYQGIITNSPAGMQKTIAYNSSSPYPVCSPPAQGPQNLGNSQSSARPEQGLSSPCSACNVWPQSVAIQNRTPDPPCSSPRGTCRSQLSKPLPQIVQGSSTANPSGQPASTNGTTCTSCNQTAATAATDPKATAPSRGFFSSWFRRSAPPKSSDSSPSTSSATVQQTTKQPRIQTASVIEPAHPGPARESWGQLSSSDVMVDSRPAPAPVPLSLAETNTPPSAQPAPKIELPQAHPNLLAPLTNPNSFMPLAVQKRLDRTAESALADQIPSKSNAAGPLSSSVPLPSKRPATLPPAMTSDPNSSSSNVPLGTQSVVAAGAPPYIPFVPVAAVPAGLPPRPPQPFRTSSSQLAQNSQGDMSGNVNAFTTAEMVATAPPINVAEQPGNAFNHGEYPQASPAPGVFGAMATRQVIGMPPRGPVVQAPIPPNPAANGAAPASFQGQPGQRSPGYPNPPSNSLAWAAPVSPASYGSAAGSANSQQWIDTLRDSLYPSQRELAADKLAECDWRTHPQVVNALTQAACSDPAATVRAGCIHCLARMKANTMPVVSALQSLKNDADSRVRVEAEQALTTLAPQMGKFGIQPVSGQVPIRPQ